MDNKIFSKTLKIENGRLIRNVDNITEAETIIDFIKNKGLMGSSIVNTKVFSKENKLLEHEVIPYIIHSGEYTESMGYDVQLKSLEMALDLINSKVYSWDLLPHNFTYYNGNWFLYDFGALSLIPKNVITEIRGFFKITFSNFEILKYLTREELSYYYLTRIKIEDIIKLISFDRWLFLVLNMTACRLLLLLGQYKLSYIYLKKLFKYYTKNYKKEYYKYDINEQEKNLFEITNNELKDSSCVFCVGEEAAKWAVYNEKNGSNINKFAYIDDYKLCDKYYNYINEKGYKKISTAVLAPLVDDDLIPKTKSYRALYDEYAKTRFISDAVISSDFEDINILKDFTKNILIIRSCSDLTQEMKKYFNSVTNTGDLYIAKDKKDKNIFISGKKYEDGNRGPDARRQTLEILKLIQNKRNG